MFKARFYSSITIMPNFIQMVMCARSEQSVFLNIFSEWVKSIKNGSLWGLGMPSGCLRNGIGIFERLNFKNLPSIHPLRIRFSSHSAGWLKFRQIYQIHFF